MLTDQRQVPDVTEVALKWRKQAESRSEQFSNKKIERQQAVLAKRGARERDRARVSKHDHYMGLSELRNMKVALSHARVTRYLSNGDLVSNNWDCIKDL